MATEPNKIAYGGDMMLFVDSKPIAFSTDAKLEITADVREISSKDSGYWKERSPGKLDWKTSTDALYTESLTGATNDFEDLYSKMVLRVPITVVFAAKTGTVPEWTVDPAKKKFTGQAIITSLSVSAPDNETTTYSVALEATGALVMS
jgi:TP901-1 family phage major tail protein